MNSTRVNRLLMTMASIGLTIQDEHRRYLPGPGIHALAAQAIRGSSLFASALPQLEAHAPRDIVVALGVLWEDQVIYIWHSEPGERTSTSQALAGFRMLPAWQSVIGVGCWRRRVTRCCGHASVTKVGADCAAAGAQTHRGLSGVASRGRRNQYGAADQ